MGRRGRWSRNDLILTLTAARTLVAARLTYLLLLTPLHWVFKLLATLATAALIPLTFLRTGLGTGELRGLPMDGPIPPSFRMLWAQVIEPDPLKGENGHVFLGLQILDDANFPLGQPRAWQLPFCDDLKIKVNAAMRKIGEGETIQGKGVAKRRRPRARPSRLCKRSRRVFCPENQAAAAQ